MVWKFLTVASLQPCPGGVAWIAEYFGQCVQNDVQLASFWIGLISLLLWFFPPIPQLYENYKRGQCGGVSVYFLLCWFLGDSLNLAGALLSRQLPTQIFVGIYYIFQDSVILCQYCYYKVKNQWHNHLVRDLGQTTLRCVMVTATAQSLLALKSASVLHGGLDELGYSMGIVSAIFYLGGRIPQLYMNCKRVSTEGISMPMFYMMFAANFCYGLSVLLGGVGRDYLLRHLPWLTGSLGCCLLDSVIVWQHFHYRTNRAESESANILDHGDVVH
uniref:PQ-loop repeat-containing protein n=1 Tax=Trichuris muris TaxID=70415 RepID=A0A5S6QFG6_TRIMR